MILKNRVRLKKKQNKTHPAVLSPALTQVQLNMEGERRRQEKQAVLIRTWVLSGTRAASACQMKSISQWEAAGTVPHGPFHHLSHFIHATTARLKPHWLHLEPCICQFGYRVMKTIPMYECRIYCKQSIEEICAGGWGGCGDTWKRCIIGATCGVCALESDAPLLDKALGMEGWPCQDSEGLPLQRQSSVDDHCAALGLRFCVKMLNSFCSAEQHRALKRQLSIPRTPAKRRTIRRPLAPSPLLFYFGFYSVCRVFFFFFCLMITAQSETALLQRHIQRAASQWSGFMQI